MNLRATILWIISLTWGPAAHAAPIHHFIYFGLERNRIADEAFLSSAAEGAQLKYTWRELEPQKDLYDFSAIRGDLKLLRSRGKKLFVQIQDVSFDQRIVNVPAYLRSEPQYHGGVAPQYDYKDDRESEAVPAGWVARRWDPAVRLRFQSLLRALGREIDGSIEGVNLAETSVAFGESGRLFPDGFTPELYRDGIVTNMAALRDAFPRSVTIQYANFMPGEWLPWTNKFYLDTVYQRARELGVGVGGPDLLPYRKGQMNHSYPRIRSNAGKIPTGIAAQDGNYESVNPKTRKPVTVEELAGFAENYLHVDYLFWAAQDPFYKRDVLPFLNKAARKRPARLQE